MPSAFWLRAESSLSSVGLRNARRSRGTYKWSLKMLFITPWTSVAGLQNPRDFLWAPGVCLYLLLQGISSTGPCFAGSNGLEGF